MKLIRKSGISRGFTIVEVIVTLAMASLILIIIIIAVPALQRGARNYKLKKKAVETITGMNQAAADHDGNYNFFTSHASTTSSGSFGCDAFLNYLHYAGQGEPYYPFPEGEGTDASGTKCPLGYDLPFCGVASGTCNPCGDPEVCVSPIPGGDNWWYANNMDHMKIGKLIIMMDAVCSSNHEPVTYSGSTASDFNTSHFVVLASLEPGGEPYCVDNG